MSTPRSSNFASSAVDTADAAGSRTDVVRSVDVQAPAELVWQLITDLPGMGRFSPESAGGRWVGGRSGPAVGAVLRGTNRRGRRRWSTRSRVVECEPASSFAFDVSAFGLQVARWRYVVEPAGSWCRLTESWSDRRGRLVRLIGVVVTGVRDRASFAGTSMEVTLRRVKAAAEGHTGDSA